jgi:hypothetical protein
MSSPRDPRLDLSLEGLNRDRPPPPQLSETALVSQVLAQQGIQKDIRTAYEALIDAVFTAPGATEWLAGLRRAVTALLARKNGVMLPPGQDDAIRPSDPGPV